MEAKLREYRAQRRRKELIDNTKEKIEQAKDKVVNFLVPKMFTQKEKNEDEEQLLMEEEPPSPPPVFKPLIQPEDPADVASETSEVESITEEKKVSWRQFIIKWSLYTIVWVGFYLYFLSLQFGAVYFTISVLFMIYFNTRTRPKKKGEVSAYSVFNENCQSINGALKAEDLERQMVYGVAGVRAF